MEDAAYYQFYSGITIGNSARSTRFFRPTIIRIGSTSAMLSATRIRFLTICVSRRFIPRSITTSGLPFVRARAVELNHKFHRQVLIHDYVNALKTLEEMQKEGIKPDNVSYSRLLRLYTDTLDENHALETLHSMHSQGITPSTAGCNAVLHLLTRNDHAAEAEQLFHDMEQWGVIRDERTYLELIRLFAARRDVDRCLYYLNKMKEEGLDPTAPIYLDVMFALARVHRFKEALQLYEDMKRHHVRFVEQLHSSDGGNR